MATPKLLELPSGAASGSVPTVQADGTVAYQVPTTPPTINDTTPSTTTVWSSSKTSAEIAAIPGVAAATTTAAGIVQLAGDLAGTSTAPVLAALSPTPAGTYGDAHNVPAITVDGKGRVTAVTPTPIAGFYFYTGTGWPTYPTGIPCVFYSVGYTGVTGPANAADNSVWFK